MIPLKFLVTFFVIVVLVALYYLFKEISNLKKMVISNYSDESESFYIYNSQQGGKKSDYSSIYSITYRSDTDNDIQKSVNYDNFNNAEIIEIKNLANSTNSNSLTVNTNSKKMMSTESFMNKTESEKKIFQIMYKDNSLKSVESEIFGESEFEKAILIDITEKIDVNVSDKPLKISNSNPRRAKKM